jgi:hypothetical protein
LTGPFHYGLESLDADEGPEEVADTFKLSVDALAAAVACEWSGAGLRGGSSSTSQELKTRYWVSDEAAA